MTGGVSAAARELAVHDDNAAAGTQMLPCMPQHREMVRHRVVAKAEHNAVQRLAGDVFERVALGQFDVLPPLTPAERLRPPQHAARQVDAIDFAVGSHRLAQEGKIAPGAASDFEHAAARVEPKTRRRALAQVRREEQQAVEQADQAGNSIVTLRDERRFAIHPLVGHVLRPDDAGGSLLFAAARLLEMFPSATIFPLLRVRSSKHKREAAGSASIGGK